VNHHKLRKAEQVKQADTPEPKGKWVGCWTPNFSNKETIFPPE